MSTTNFNQPVRIPIEDIPFHNTPVYYVGILGILAYVAVGLRMYTRVFILKAPGWDDYTMIVALAFFTVYGVAFIELHEMISGKDQLDMAEYERSLQWLLVIEQFYTLTIMAIKISLAIFFLRIVRLTWHRWVIYVTVSISTLYSTAYFFFSIFQCGFFSNIEEFAVRRLSGAQCVSGMQALIMSFTHAAITATTDWTFAALGLFVIMRLKISLRDKLIIFIILSLGTTGSIASVLRFPFLTHTNDSAYSFYTNFLGLGVWSWWEMGLGIIAGSLACLRPLFRTAFNSARGRILSSEKAGGAGFRSRSVLNFAHAGWKLGHKRSGSSDSNSSSIRKSLIGWPLERARSTGKGRRAYDDEELLWGWGPKVSSEGTGKQKFGNTTVVSSDGNWDGAAPTLIMSDRVSRAVMSDASSHYPEDDDQSAFEDVAPLPPRKSFNPHSSRSLRLGQQMKWQGELAASYRTSGAPPSVIV